MLAALAPYDQAHDGLGSAAERHRRAAIGFQRPECRRRAAVARSGSYRFAGGNGSRTGSGLIFARIAFNVRMRGDNGNRSPSIMSSSALSRAAVSSSVRPGAAAIVACPHSETSVNAAGIPFSGYPSLLARLMNVPEDEVFLMLVGGGLRIVHVTLHERLHTALGRITSELIERATRTADAALRKLNIEQPRIGLFGINPHAGEGGLFGDDDDRITVPAAKRLQALGLNVEGPIGADLMLARCDFDAFVAMYHDQGHIPVKLLAGRNSAALSIGSGLLFSSVGHGSAFDIAGRGIAKPEAVLRSIQLLGGASYFEDVAAL